MARLMDLGLDRSRNMILDMAELSSNTVNVAIDSYVQGRDLRDRVYGWSEELRLLQDEVSELAVELLARYQPVASDLSKCDKTQIEVAGKQAEDMIRLSIKAFADRDVKLASTGRRWTI